MRRRERGSALMIVMMALLVLLPLALTLLVMVTSRLRQTVHFREMVQQEMAARAGLAQAAARLENRDMDLREGGGAPLVVEGLPGYAVTVRVDRQPDVILSVEGRALGRIEAARVDLRQFAIDGEGRRIFRYRKIEVYLVESSIKSRGSLAGARLRAVLARKPDGTIAQVGARLERGFFP